MSFSLVPCLSGTLMLALPGGQDMLLLPATLSTCYSPWQFSDMSMMTPMWSLTVPCQLHAYDLHVGWSHTRT